MIRKVIPDSEFDHPYVLEVAGDTFYITESQFRQLAFESISLLDDLLKEKWENHFEKMKVDSELTDDEFEKKHWKSRN